MPRLHTPDELHSLRTALITARESWPVVVTLSSGTCGEASGSLAVLAALDRRLQEQGLAGKVHVRVTGCQGFCQQEPLLTIDPLDAMYCKVTPADVDEIVTQSIAGGRVIER